MEISRGGATRKKRKGGVTGDRPRKFLCDGGAVVNLDRGSDYMNLHVWQHAKEPHTKLQAEKKNVCESLVLCVNILAWRLASLCKIGTGEPGWWV